MPAGASASLSQPPESSPLDLWWLWEPALYELVTEVSVGGEVIDEHITRFGNREWEVRGNQFYLNGVRQHLRSDLTHYNGNIPRKITISSSRIGRRWA